MTVLYISSVSKHICNLHNAFLFQATRNGIRIADLVNPNFKVFEDK